MILDTLERMERYTELLPGLALVKKWIGKCDDIETSSAADCPAGDIELEGRKVFVRISDNIGRGEKGAKLEYHRRYVDVQIPLRGSERIGWIPLEKCGTPLQPYEVGKDIGFYSDRPETWFDVKPGWFCILFPEDGHATLAGEGPLKKAIAKIEL